MTDLIEKLKKAREGTTSNNTDNSNNINNNTNTSNTLSNIDYYKRYYDMQGFTQPKQPNKFLNFLGGLGTVLNTFPRMGSAGFLYNLEKAKQSVQPSFASTLAQYGINRDTDYWKTWAETLANKGKYRDSSWVDVYNLVPQLQKPIAESIPALGQALQRGTEKHPDKFTNYTNQFLASITPASALGFVTDIVADPLTWLGAAGSSSIGSGLKSASKALMGTKFGNTLSALSKIPQIRGLKKVFSPLAESGLNKELYLAKRLTEKEAKHNTAKFIIDELNPMLKGVKQADRELVKTAMMNEFDKSFYLKKLSDIAGDTISNTGKYTAEDSLYVVNKIKNLTKQIDELPEALKPIKSKIQSIFEETGQKELKTGQIPKMLDEYFPGIYKDKTLREIIKQGKAKVVGSDIYKFAQEKIFKTFEQAQKAGKTVDNLENVIAKRMKAHFDRMGRYNFLEEAKRFAIPDSELKSFSVGSQKYIKQGLTDVTGIDQLKGFKFEPEIAEALGRVQQFTNDTDLQSLAKMFIDHPLGIWKLSATAVNPGFHIRNFMSNYWLLYLKDGAEAFNPFRNMLNLDILTAKQTGRLDKTIKFGNKTMTYGEVLDLAGKRGVLGGFFGEELASTGGKKFSKPLDALRKVSGGVEDQARMLGFINDMFKTGGDDIVSAQRVWKYLFDYGELTKVEQGWFKRLAPFYCVDTQTEALTKKGWKKYNEINLNDEVLTININNSNAEWKTVDGLFVSEYSGDMYSLEQQVISALVTPDHKWAIKSQYNHHLKLKETKDLNTSDIIPVCAELIDLPQDKYYDDDFVRLIGWVVTEGHYKKNNGYTIEISQSTKANPKYVLEIKNILNRLKVNYHEFDAGINKSIHYFGVTKNYANYIRELLPSKILTSEFILKLTKEQINILIETMCKADGSYSYNNIVLQTNNKDQADAIQFLLSIGGYPSYIGKRLFTTGFGKGKHSYNITIRLRENAKVTGTKINVVNYNGIIWCPKTENETWFARRNGKVYFTGNTWLRKNVQLQVEELFKQPGKFAGIEKFKTALESLSENNKPDETYLPEYFEKLYAMRMPIKDEDGNYLYLNPNLAFQDINKINDFVDMYSAINPFIRMPIEMMFNYNAYYKQPIQNQDYGFKYSLTQAPFPGFVADQLEKLPESLLEKLAMYKSDEGLKMRKRPEYAFKSIPFLYSLAKSFPQEEAKTPSTLWRALSWLAGIKFLPYDEATQKEYYDKDILKTYQDNLGKLKYRGKVPEDFSLTDIKKLIGGNTKSNTTSNTKSYNGIESLIEKLNKAQSK